MKRTKPLPSIPKRMSAIVLSEYRNADGIGVRELRVPKPARDEVLVRIVAAPINPSDLIFINGDNPTKRELPAVPGFEGSGLVIAAGSDSAARKLLGRKVACRATPDRNGTWAELLVTKSDRCVPVSDEVSWSEAATMLVNPLTAWMLFFRARQEKHKAAIQTAAASALGKMVVRLGQEFSYPMIHVARTEAQVGALERIGAKWVLDSSSPDFPDELRKLARKLGATVAFDAVSGPLTNLILRAMPPKSQIWSYGGLSGQPCELDPMQLIYEQKSVVGFWGPPQALALGPKKFNAVIKQIEKRLSTVFKTDIRAIFPLRDVKRALETYRGQMSGGKIILAPAE